MCGRARLDADYSEISNGFRIPAHQPRPNLKPHWNLPPMEESAIVHLDKAGERLVDVARWSLLPYWSKTPKLGYATFNARDIDEKGQSVAERPAFREPFRHRRCLVPFNCFYEWRKRGVADNQPFAIALQSGALMAVAGLWERWRSRDKAETIKSFTVITTEPNAVMAELHDRMPVILGPDDWPRWLGESEASVDELQALLRPCPDEWLKMWPVDRRVGNVKNDAPEFVQEIMLAESAPGTPLLL